jgi:ATP-dependent Zn protease
MVLLGGRVAEEIFYGYSITTGAKKDLEEAYKLSKNMIIHYGMGNQTIYPDLSDQSKYLIDQEINKLLLFAHEQTTIIITQCKDLIMECSELLKKTNVLKPEDIIHIIDKKYQYLWKIYDIRKDYM